MRDGAAGEALLGQRWVRAAIASTLVLIQFGLAATLPGHGDGLRIVAVLAAYLLVLVVVSGVVRLRGRAAPSVVTLALVADLTFLFVTTAVSTAPAHYERALFGTMVVIHVANFYYGRRQAWRVLGIGFAFYLALLLYAALRGLPVDGVEELYTLAVGVVGTILVVAQAGHVRRRLRAIVELFERAEHGDFTLTYDEAADHRFDAITRVGRAYNRVRMQLASMVLSDPLTGCLNRRGFEQALAREVARSARVGSELSLLLLDLDHFKRINDTHGHAAGDDVLRAMGRLLLTSAREGDIVGRVGGEEFAMLLPDTGGRGAQQFATRLCGLVRAYAYDVESDGRTLGVTTSIGIATVQRRDGRHTAQDGPTLMRQADIALYAAKRAGRDRPCVWTPQLETLPSSADPHDEDLVVGRS